MNEHPDVHVFSQILEPNPKDYSPEQQKEYLTHMKMAQSVYGKMKPEALETTRGHENTLEDHLNKMTKMGLLSNTDTYLRYLTDKFQRGADNANTIEKKDNKVKRYSDLSQQLIHNKDHFEKLMKLYHHLNDAKHVLINVASKNDPYYRSKNNHQIDPERFIGVNKDNSMIKYERNKPKSNMMNEENFASSGAIRGMGYVSGDPGGSLQTYTTLNASDADTQDQILNSTKKHYHDDLHTNIPDVKKESLVNKITSVIKGKR